METKYRSEIKALKDELDREMENKANLQERLKRAVKANKDKNNKDDGSNSTVSQRKINRLEKDVQAKELEITAKQKKLDQMFLRLSEIEQKYNSSNTENIKLKDDMRALKK